MLHGDLGAGKTAFVRGLAAGLGANPDDVSSPTFVLIQHYKGRTPLVHVDLYRLETGAAIDDLGLEELASGAVVAIEWAERLPRTARRQCHREDRRSRVAISVASRSKKEQRTRNSATELRS